MTAMSEFEDQRLQGAMRAYLRAVDALADAAGDADDKVMLEAADAKRLAELVLRSRLAGYGWSQTRQQQEPARKSDGENATT